MDIVKEEIANGIIERRFDLKVDQEVVPGIHWLPEKPKEKIPTILLGHGGTQHKRVVNVLEMAQSYVTELGWAAVALDAPNHGERVTEEQRAAQRTAAAEGAQRPRGGPGLLGAAPKAVKEWKALIDDLQTNPAWADGPFGYWGVSMGCAFGMPLIASEPRISAAVLGLAGARDDSSLESAKKITIPLMFLFQSEDQLMNIDSGIRLWQAFGSTEKAFHMNPGGHTGIPKFERKAARDFFQRHFEGVGQQ